LKTAKAIALLVIALMLLSCEKNSFKTSSVSLKSVSLYSGSGLAESRLILHASISKDGTYELELVSPDGDLTWHEKMAKSDSGYVSEPLLITDGAFFPRGEYVYSLISDDGVTISGKVLYENDLSLNEDGRRAMDSYGNEIVMSAQPSS